MEGGGVREGVANFLSTRPNPRSRIRGVAVRKVLREGGIRNAALSMVGVLFATVTAGLVK